MSCVILPGAKSEKYEKDFVKHFGDVLCVELEQSFVCGGGGIIISTNSIVAVFERRTELHSMILLSYFVMASCPHDQESTNEPANGSSATQMIQRQRD